MKGPPPGECKSMQKYCATGNRQTFLWQVWPHCWVPLSVLVVRTTLASTYFTYPAYHRLGLSQCIWPSGKPTLRLSVVCRTFVKSALEINPWGSQGWKQERAEGEVKLQWNAKIALVNPTRSCNGSPELDLDRQATGCGLPWKRCELGWGHSMQLRRFLKWLTAMFSHQQHNRHFIEERSRRHITVPTTPHQSWSLTAYFVFKTVLDTKFN